MFGWLTKGADKAKAALCRAVVTLSRRQVARYDALRHNPSRPAPTPRLELTETEQIFCEGKRIRSYLLADNLYDNDSCGATIDSIVRLVVGIRGGNPQFSGENRAECEARWKAWKRHAGWQEGEQWQEVLSTILRAVLVHGDCLVLCDANITQGKVRIFDADQVCNLTDFRAWNEANGGEGWRQCEGVVINAEGQVKGYFVTSLRNCAAVPSASATFLPASSCRLVRQKKKITQYRGESALLANEELTHDTRSLIKSEVAAAKNAAEISLIFEDPAGAGDDDIANLLDGISAEELTEGTDVSTEALAREIGRNEGRNDYTAFEGKSAIGRVAHGTGVHELNNQARPSGNLQQFMSVLDITNGKRLGVWSAIAEGKANASYSAGQIEVALSWQTVDELAKMLERQVVDYVLEAILPEATYVVMWNKAFEIDPAKAEATLDSRLRGGRTTYREVLGDNWREKFDQLAQEVAYAREKGIPLSLMQGISGGEITQETEAGNEG